ncbi:MAG: ATPase, partial [Eubacterium sp.]|nr:ATPase [Eubacterium sp.]
KDFYKIESTVDGRHFVTARGWEDLSEMIRLYEENDLTVDEDLISQYIQHTRISKDFAIYYDLFRKYQSDYKIEEILAGHPGEDVLFRAKRAPVDEKLSFLGLLFDAVTADLKTVCDQEDLLDALMPLLRELRGELTDDRHQKSAAEALESLDRLIDRQMEVLEKGRKASSLSPGKQYCLQRVAACLQSYKGLVVTQRCSDSEEAFHVIREAFSGEVDKLKGLSDKGRMVLDHAFDFCEKAFEDGDEILIFVTELTVNYYTARYIGHYGCDKYFLHNKELQFSQRQMELDERVKKLDWTL